MRIIDQNVRYDVKENDEEVYGGDIYIEFRRLGGSSENFLLYAGVKQSDEVSQCGIVSVDSGLIELLVTEDIEQYADKISNVIVSDDKKYIFYAGEQAGSIVCLKKECDTGVVTELLKESVIEAEEIDLQKTGDLLTVIIDNKQLWNMKMSDKEPELLIENNDISFFQSTMGRYIIYGHNDEIQKLFDLETCEYIELPLTFNKKNTDVIRNQSNTKIMFFNVNDFYDDNLSEKEIYVFDIETKEMSSYIYNMSDLSYIVSVSWFDDDRIIVQGVNDIKDYYEILEEKDKK